MPTTSDNLPPKKIKYYVAIRKSEDSNQEFFELDTLNALETLTNEIMKRSNREMNYWAKANPVVRIAVVHIVEIS